MRLFGVTIAAIVGVIGLGTRAWAAGDGFVPYARRPPVLDYTAGDPIPIGYHLEERHPKWMLITGPTTLGGAYFISVLNAGAIGGCFLAAGSCTPTDSAYQWLYVPLAGPFIALSHTTRGAPGLVFLGTAQIVGLGIWATGLLVTTTKLVPDLYGTKTWIIPDGKPGYAGLQLVGTFE
jgi:hypothetical protein